MQVLVEYCSQLKDAKSLDWFTRKEGNYITSTAYMIAAVAAWIAIYERDTVFLQFGKESLTTQFSTFSILKPG